MKNNHRPIWIQWIDSNSYTARWYGSDEAIQYAKEDNILCESIGFFLYENDVKIALCESLAYTNGEVTGVHGLNVIPLVAILDWDWKD